MKHILIFIISFTFRTPIIGQQRLETNKNLNNSLIPSSPAATYFGIFGETPVSNFTGTPDITVPLYQVSYKELGINLSLKYHQAIGNKPDLFPGLTGSGWLLNTGGIITRVSRGATSVNFAPGTLIPLSGNTDVPEWSSDVKMQNYIKNQAAIVNNEGQYDEYSYSFNGISGKFYTDHNGTIRITSTQGEDLIIEKQSASHLGEEIQVPYEDQQSLSCLAVIAPYSNSLKQIAFIKKFVITDSKGIKYTFGGTNESIEFMRPGMAFAKYDLYNENTIPINWYLTSIKSPQGYQINLQYTRGKFYITNEISVNDKITIPSKWADSEDYPKGKKIKSILYHPCYIDKIITPISSVKFNWSLADQQLGYNFIVSNPPISQCNGWDAPDRNSEFYFCKYPEIKDAAITNRFPNKLDNFIVSTLSGVQKKFVEFFYTSQVTTRLKLTSVKIKGEEYNYNEMNVPTYTFEYNSQPLPAYLSFKTDEYGFYNGRNLYITSDDPYYYYNFFNNPVNRQAYSDSRKTDINYLQAEILKKIIYPTGGSTEYVYESNQYGRVAKFWPSSIQENANGVENAGGLRIKRIINYDYGSHIATEKKYYYNLNYSSGGTTSSGVLNYQPQYSLYFNGNITPPARYSSNTTLYSGIMDFRQYGTDPVNPPNYNRGTPITYSEVAEVNLDGSYTVFKYKNYDNGFHDMPAENMICDNSNVSAFWKEDDMNSMELERGQVISEEIYAPGNIIKVKSTYEYNDNPNRFENNVRRLKLISNSIFSRNFPSIRYTANLIYTYFPYLKKKTTDIYEQNGTITNTINYVFNEQNRLLTTQTTTNSKNKTIVISNKYSVDYPSDPVLTEMANNNVHIIAPIIETALTKDGQQVRLTHVNYYSPFSGIYVPQNTQVKLSNNSSEPIQFYDEYDVNGNIRQEHKSNDVNTSYIWDFDNSLPIAEVLNADASSIAYTSFETAGTNSGWSFTGTPEPDYNSPTGNKSYDLSNNSIETKSTVVTLNNSKTYIVTYWSRSGEQTVKNQAGSSFSPTVTGVNINGWVYYKYKVTGATKIIISGDGVIDELRLYPLNAQMNTYTYDPLVGITSKCTNNNDLFYYEYDEFGRLKLEKDQNRNILKKYCYNYAGQTENCSTLPVDVTISAVMTQAFNGFSAKYTNTSTGNEYVFSMTATAGSQTLGTLKSGNYKLTISGNGTQRTFGSGCGSMMTDGTSATFYNIIVGPSDCKQISIK